MRRAQVDDARRRLGGKKGNWPNLIRSVRYTELPSLGTGEILIESPLTIFAGENGAGKTTLLKSIWASLAPDESAASVVGNPLLESGSVSLDILADDQAIDLVTTFSNTGAQPNRTTELQVFHIDGAASSRRAQLEFRKFANSEEFLDGIGGYDLSEAELNEVRYLTNRRYLSVRMYEVELDGNAPFFEVTYGDTHYDSRTMGSGEIAALQIWWALRSAPRYSMVLVEEPEAFLSPGCQQNFANFLCDCVVKKSLCVMASSHSAQLISSSPPSSVCFLARTGCEMARVADAPAVLLEKVGISPQIKNILLVEDDLAAMFLTKIVESYDPTFSQTIQIETLGGHGEISRLLASSANFRGPIPIVGIYDGDAKDQVGEELLDRSVFLPATVRLERVFRDLVDTNRDVFRPVAAREIVDPILDAIEGDEDHDWFENLRKHLGIARKHLFGTFFTEWFKIEENQAAARSFYEEFESKTNR